MKNLSEKVDMFLHLQQKKLNSQSHDSVAPQQLVRENSDPECEHRDYCTMLEQSGEHIMGKGDGVEEGRGERG